MTISSPVRIAGPYIGAGTLATFSFTFKVFSASDIEVVQVVVSTGAQTTLTLTTDYTVALNGNQNTNPGGSITLVAGNLPTGTNLVITSNVLNLQPTDLTNQGGFYPEVINDSLDRATIQIQQLNDTAQNAVHAPVTDGALAMTLPSAGIRANKFLAFGATGLPVASDGTTTPAITSGGDITLTANDAGSNVNRDVIFVDNTTERMRLTGANGRLGIGTATPAVALDVVGAAAVSGNMTVTGAASVSANLTVDTDTLFVNATANTIGIGTTSPQQKLGIHNAGAVSSGLRLTNSTTGNPGSAAGLDIIQNGNNASITNQQSGTMFLGTNGVGGSTPGVNITATGRVGINDTTSLTRQLQVNQDTNSQYIAGFASNATSLTHFGITVEYPNGSPNGTSNFFIRCADSTANRFLVLSNGTCQNVTGTYTTISDLKLKEQVADASSQWDDIKSIRLVNYKLKSDVAQFGASAPSMLGVVAQELEIVCPGLVYESDDLDADNNLLGTTTKSVKQSILYMKAVKALQEAILRIEQLEARVAALEAGA
jgi:hypothetical protein